MSMSNSGVRPEDRLFHLILALMSSSFGLTKDQILGSVRGYVPEGDSPASAETLERRFERDKDALRDLGIPLEVSIPAAEDSNNRFTTYRIRKGDYDLPEGVWNSLPLILLSSIFPQPCGRKDRSPPKRE